MSVSSVELFRLYTAAGSADHTLQRTVHPGTQTRETVYNTYYPRDALHSAVFAVVRCPSVTHRDSLFYENALIDTEKAFLNFIKTHGGNVQKRTENYTETHKVTVE